MKMLRALFNVAIISLTLLLSAPAFASQGSGCMPTTGTVSGLTLVQDINAGIAAIISSNSGGTAPATDCTALAIKGQIWLDTSTTPATVRYYDGTSTNWLPIGVIDATNHIWTPPIGGGVATTITSATTTDLWSVPQSAVTISGTTTITALANASATIGTIKKVTFSGILTLTNNVTSLILPGGANITTAAGDSMDVLAVTSTNVKITQYTKASGFPVAEATRAAHTIRSNITGSPAVDGDNSLTAILDAELGSTQGQIAYRNATTWVPLSPGTAGQLLQTGGASANPSWATVSAPVLLNTLTASSSASLADTTSLTSSYPRYKIVFINVLPASNTVSCRLRVNVGGVKTSGYLGTLNGASNGSGFTIAETTFIQCSREVQLANTGSGISAEFTITNPSQTASPKYIYGDGAFLEASTASVATFTVAGSYTSGNGAMTGFQVDMSSGNIASGTIYVYGLP